MIRRKVFGLLVIMVLAGPYNRAQASTGQTVPGACIDWAGRSESERPRDGRSRIHVVYIVKDRCTDIPWGGVLIGDRALVPFRRFGEALGVSTQWEPDITNSATGTAWYVGSSGASHQHVVRTTIGDSRLYVDGLPVALNVPSHLIDGRTFVPFRALGDAFDGEVWWEPGILTAVVRVRDRYSPNDLGDLKERVVLPGTRYYFSGVLNEWPLDEDGDGSTPPGEGRIRPQHGVGLFWTKSYKILKYTKTGVNLVPLGAFSDGKRPNIVRQRCNLNVPSLKVKLGHKGVLKVSTESETTVKAELLESKLKSGLEVSVEVSEEQEVEIPKGKKVMLRATDMATRHDFLIEITWTSLKFGGGTWVSTHVDSRTTRVVVWEPHDRSYAYELGEADDTCGFPIR